MAEQPTLIREILKGVECDERALADSNLAGHLLMDEIIKLAAMTTVYYVANELEIDYLSPYGEMRSRASLKQLLEYAALTDKRHHAFSAFYEIALEGQNMTERQFAAHVLIQYAKTYHTLALMEAQTPISPKAVAEDMDRSIAKRTPDSLTLAVVQSLKLSQV